MIFDSFAHNRFFRFFVFLYLIRHNAKYSIFEIKAQWRLDPEKYACVPVDIKSILDRARQEQLAQRGQLTKNAAKKNCVAAIYEAAEDDWTKVKELIKQLDQPQPQVILAGWQEPQAQLVGQGQLTKSAARV